MTPEEKAVVEAAMKEHRGCAAETCGGTSYDPCRLGDAIDALIRSCSTCNAGGHTCPGCGARIGHTQTACAPCSALASDWVENSPPVWVAVKWLDVCAGDHVRLPGVGAEADVESIGDDQHWHVKPGTGDGPRNPPVALEHALTPVRLAGRDKPLFMPTTGDIEILMDATRRAAYELQRAFPGSKI